LERPDTYVGDVTIKKVSSSISRDLESIELDSIFLSDALQKVIHEVFSNAIDNVSRSIEAGTPMTYIKISFSSAGEITVRNDGHYIPVELTNYPYVDAITKESRIDTLYPAELFFGYFLSGTNYDDKEKRRTSGRNGLGAKLTNIYSKSFKVSHYDPKRKRYFEQQFSNNMRDRTVPEVTEIDLGEAFTEISFIPDYKYFKISDPKQILPVLRKSVLDISLNSGLPVQFNDEVVKISNFADYVCRMEFLKEAEKLQLYVRTEDSSVENLLIFGPGQQLANIAFVNGIETKEGGVHLNSWKNLVLPQIVSAINELSEVKKAEIKVTLTHVKDAFWFAVKTEIDNPTFRSQTKDFLTSPIPIAREMTESELKTLFSWKSVQEIWKEIILRRSLKKPPETREDKIKLAGKLHDANNAGPTYGYRCNLFITEGDSASLFALRGIKELGGMDWNGVLPLRGKPLNSWKASPKKIFENNEIRSIIATLNIDPSIDYELEENLKKLRYRNIILLTDQDDDGLHIRALLIALFSRLSPGILKFLRIMSTPLVRVFKKGKPIQDAYSLFDTLLNGSGTTVKYYKGLGSFEEGECQPIFKVLKLTSFEEEEAKSRVSLLDRALGEKSSSERKKLILQYDPALQFPIEGTATLDLFIRTQLSQYHRAAVDRAIPDLVDGFKESQRKVFYGMRKMNYKDPKKVIIVAGDVMRLSGYHHGETSLYDTIINMAQNFVGCGSAPLLEPRGEFGSRVMGGKDAAAARYIFTKLSKNADLYFKKEDDELLTIKKDGDEEIEPERFYPILPMILLNSCIGVGSGWKSTIPCFSLKSIIDYMKCKIFQTETVDRIAPFYPGHKGETTVIYSKGRMRLVSKGIIKESDGGVFEISELPVGVWIQDFIQEFKEKLELPKLVSKVHKDYSPTELKIRFRIDNESAKPILEKLLTKSQLQTPVLLLPDGTPKTYQTAEEIVDDFMEFRLKIYKDRCESIQHKLMDELLILENKLKFIELSLEKKIDLYDKLEKMNKILEIGKLMKIENSFDYLTSMPIKRLTEEERDKLKKEIERLNRKIEENLSKTPIDIWVEELNELI
jgi:DNA topoisomerase-2